MKRASMFALLLLAGCVGSPSGAPALACGPCAFVIDATAERAWEPTVAVDPRDAAHLVALSGQFHETATGDVDLWMVAYVSRDGGSTWKASRVPGPERTTHHADPVAIFLADGALLVAGLAWARAEPPTPIPADAGTAISTFVVRSEDGGDSFGAPIVVAEGRGASLAGISFGEPTTDKPWLALAPDGTVLMTYLAYSNPHPDQPTVLFGVADLQVITSKDGRAWSAPRALPRPEHSPHMAFPAVEADGTWHVAFIDADFEKDFFLQQFGLWLATSRDQGATWDAKKIGTTPWMPTLRAHGGRLFLAAPADTGDPNVQPPMLMTSDDHGATWSPPLILDEAGTGRAMVAMDVDARGVVYVGYYANAPAEDGNAEFRIVRVERDALAAPLTLEDALKGPTRQRGHYVGVAAAPEGAYAVWVSGDALPAFDVSGARVA